MLGTLTEKLSSLLSKGAFVSSFIPLLAFATVNAFLLASIHPPFRNWVVAHRTDAEVVSGLVIAFLICSLVFATINTRLRELMEGRFWPQALCSSFTASEQRRLDALNASYSTLQRSRRILDREGPKWTPRLKWCREHQPKRPNREYAADGHTALLVRALQERSIRGEVIHAGDLKRAVTVLCRELLLTPMTPALDGDQVKLNAAVDYARAKTTSESIRVFNERQFGFPDRFPAPTAMGNIALSIRSYALSRYQLNLESIWTRLQKVIQSEPFYGVLQDSKIQLDFLVSMFWLSIVSTAVWLIALATVGYALTVYLAIAATGPIVVWALYGLVLQSYRAFADLMRSAVDMYRLRLLDELRLPYPTGSREEAALWQALQDRMDYAKDFNLAYRKPSP